MTNVVQFPTPLRMEQFFADEALREQVRMCLAAACGAYYGKPTDDERRFAMAKIEEAIMLIRSEYAVTHP